MRSSMLIFWLVSFYGAAAAPDQMARILGGQNAQRRQFPYVVSIQTVRDGDHITGGALISPTWVLSAAYWFKDLIPFPEFNAVAGMLTKHENHADNQVRRAVEFLKHPDYREPHNDLCLIKVESPFTITDAVKTIPLVCTAQDLQIGQDVWTAGWGIYNTNMGYPDTLQYLTMSLMNWQECQQREGGKTQITQNMLCGLPEAVNQAICDSDEGNPLVQDDVLIGIKSGEVLERCHQALTGLPNVYVNVNSYLTYIVQTTQESFCGLRPTITTTTTTTARTTPSGGIGSSPSLVAMFSLFGASLCRTVLHSAYV